MTVPMPRKPGSNSKGLRRVTRVRCCRTFRRSPRALLARASPFLGFILIDGLENPAESLLGSAEHGDTVPHVDEIAPVIAAAVDYVGDGPFRPTEMFEYLGPKEQATLLLIWLAVRDIPRWRENLEALRQGVIAELRIGK
jgi:hypothetical protein